MDLDGASTCTRCGAPAPADPHDLLGWSCERVDGGLRRTCPACTRACCRSIEARLDEAWW